MSVIVAHELIEDCVPWCPGPHIGHPLAENAGKANITCPPSSPLSTNNQDLLKDECCICQDHNDLLITSCKHIVCKTCILNWKEKTCPMCRTKLKDWVSKTLQL